MKRKIQQPYRPYKPAAHYSPEELRQAEIADLEADYKCAIRDGLVDYAEKVKIQLDRLKAQENPAFVKTARDERLWAEAKKAVGREYAVKKGSKQYWALVNRIFTRMKYRIGGGAMPESNPCHRGGNPRDELGYIRSMTYGVMPSREEFSEAFGDEVYFAFGNDPRVGTAKLTEDELWDELQKALAVYEESDYPYSEAAGDWVSTVLDVLGFEWV